MSHYSIIMTYFREISFFTIHIIELILIYLFQFTCMYVTLQNSWENRNVFKKKIERLSVF